MKGWIVKHVETEQIGWWRHTDGISQWVFDSLEDAERMLKLTPDPENCRVVLVEITEKE